MELTDPALEIAGIARDICDRPINGNPFCTELASYFEIDPAAPEFLEIVATIRRRISRLHEFTQNVDDVDLTSLQRQQALGALNRLATFFNPSLFGNTWQQARAHATTEDALALTWFSHVVRKHRPLRRFSEEERLARSARSLNRL